MDRIASGLKQRSYRIVDLRPKNRARTYIATAATIAALLVAFVGAIVMIGWLTHSITLVQLRRSWVPMQFNTAIGFVLGGLALSALISEQRRVSTPLAVVLAILGTTTYGEYLLGTSTGIDTLLNTPFTTTLTEFPGRMAPNTALAFSFLAFGILGASFWRPVLLAGLVGGVVFAMGLVPAIRYATYQDAISGIWGSTTAMAFHTSIGFVVCGLVMLVFAAIHDRSRTRWAALPTMTIISVAVVLLHSSISNAPEYDMLRSVTWIGGIVLGVATTLAVYFAQSFWHGQLQLREANQKLEQRARRLSMATEELDRLATIDPLTNALNRRGLERAIVETVSASSRYGIHAFALMIDLDNFKAINDDFGHDAGDDVLRFCAAAIFDEIRPYDSCGRVGGDEFMVVMATPDPSNAVRIADRIRKSISSAADQVPSIDATLSASIGIAEIEHGDSLDELISRAARQLKSSKIFGKNRVSY
ncbi:MAG: diguanylate cyclase [Polyangiales bacterium]